MTLLQKLQNAYTAYIDEHGIAPDYLLLKKNVYSELVLELATEAKLYRPYIDDVTILEMETGAGWLYVKK